MPSTTIPGPPAGDQGRLGSQVIVPQAVGVDAEALAAELRRNPRFEGEVRFDRGSRALYATDGSNYRQVPIGVVVPRTIDDVIETVAAARRHGAPVLSRGCGTSLAGQCCNVAVVMDFSKYLHSVVHIDVEARLGAVQPGCVLDTLRGAAIRHGLNFAPDPATHSHCTLGGMLGNNSCGTHSLLAAKHGLGLRTSDNTHALEVLTYDGTRMRVGETSPLEMQQFIDSGGRRGEIYAQLRAFIAKYERAIRRMPKLPRRVSGYNLDALLPENRCNIAQALVGSEGTLVVILEAVLTLVPNPKARSMVVFGYPDIYTAGDHVMDILPLKPTGLEGIDHLLFEWTKRSGDVAADLKLLPEGKGFLIVEFGGDSKEDSDEQARQCMEVIKKTANPPSMKLYDDEQEEHKVWEVRENGLGATAWVPGRSDSWPGWEDSAVPPEKIGPYLRDLRKLFSKYGYEPSLYGHLGQGCVHCRVGFDLYTADGLKTYREFLDEAADLVVSYGGSLSGEHGDGQARGELLSKMYEPEMMEAFREFKRIWDPRWKMNPGKVIDPFPVLSNLRLGESYHPPQVRTHFNYPKDKYTFARAALRCVGVGNCRREGGGVMCPSYMATREEMHSTRGRARLLWEMLNGELRDEGWKSEPVKEALDLCLACKGCKGDCPVNVDIATYKAEFLSHYYKGRMRPRNAYAMGLIHWWARLASLAPELANFFSQTPVLRDVAKWLGGIAQERRMPPFAPETFKEWFRHRQPKIRTDATPVILWPDTFTNHFHPEIAKAAVEVLEAAGCEVLIPRQSLCCGRPLYDFGMLDVAKRLLRQILDSLRQQIRAGIPMIGLEPSCLSVFRDELINLFPHDEDARRLSKKCFLLSEYLHQRGFKPPQLHRKALMHGHCHHRSIFGIEPEMKLLKEMGLEVEVPESGCCGMAGSFGFEPGDHYRVSMACGERALLPAVRQAENETLIIADGFSCQEQIAQTTNRRALHLAQVLQLALRAGPDGPNGRPEERSKRLSADWSAERRRRNTKRTLIGAGALAAGLLIWSALRRER
jgi:FAD/FMN-containing dehydrogenase/Fe-S oxidoreductase